MKTTRKQTIEITLKRFEETPEESLVHTRKYKSLWKHYELKCLLQNYLGSIPLMNPSFISGKN
jgi:hypothetical protein